MKPKIVCLCGSTRFKEAFEQASREETLQGNTFGGAVWTHRGPGYVRADKSYAR